MFDRETEDRLARFYGGESDIDRQFRLAQEKAWAPDPEIQERQKAEAERLTAALATIGSDSPIPAHPHQPAVIRTPQLPHDYDPATDPDVIWDTPEETPYDKANGIYRQLRNERDELTAKTERTQIETLRLAQLKGLVDAAQKKMKLELDRADDPVWRERRRTDSWRSGSGRVPYNAGRRTTRAVPNAGYEDLSALTAEEKEERAAEQRYVSNLRSRLKGLPEDEIEARVEAGLAKRRAKKAATFARS